MTSRIEQAARVLFEGGAYGTWDDAEDWQKAIYRGHAHDLAEAGLLVTGEEWRAEAENDNGEFEIRTYNDACSAFHWAAGGTVEHRGVGEWQEVTE